MIWSIEFLEEAEKDMKKLENTAVLALCRGFCRKKQVL